VPLPNQTVRIENPAKARIYIIRPQVSGGIVSIIVYENGERIGVTGGCGYLCWERPPGKVSLGVKYAGSINSIALNVAAGKVYYIKQNINLLEEIDEARGKKYLKECDPPQVESGVKVHKASRRSAN
jgi:hypothetical protein